MAKKMGVAKTIAEEKISITLSSQKEWVLTLSLIKNSSLQAAFLDLPYPIKFNQLVFKWFGRRNSRIYSKSKQCYYQR